MSKPSIEVRNLSKRYRIGVKEKESSSFLGSVRDVLTAPLRNFRKLQSLSKFNDDDDESILWALKDVNFDVHEGEVLGIIGKNGAGKSTLLKILARITPPTEGHFIMRGRVASLLEVGTGFHKELTGRENVYLNGTILGMKKSEIDRKFDEIVDFSGVEKFIDTPVKRYSSGMGVRLAFAVAAHLDPELLIIDEVLAVGDAEFQKKCLGKMEDISNQGRTVLFVSHNMQALRNLCSRTIWLKNGTVVEDGDTHQVVDHYLSKFMSYKSEYDWDNRDDAPGNEYCWFKHASVKPSTGSNDFISMKTPFEVNFKFYAENVDGILDITFHVKNEADIILFGTSTSVLSETGMHVTNGWYEARCFIPGNLMNSGRYRIDVFVVKNRKEVLYRNEHLLVFDVEDSNEHRKGGYYKKLAGVVRPMLEWEYNQL